MNTDTKTITDRVIAVDYRMSLDEMIRAGDYDLVNPFITPEEFPIEGIGKKKFRTKLFDFGRHISSEVAVAAMKAGNFLPASHVHCLAYGAAFPDEQRENPIACLGGDRVVCLSRDGGKRILGLGVHGDFVRRWRFLGVQEVSEA
jgi:hypothetical protein